MMRVLVNLFCIRYFNEKFPADFTDKRRYYEIFNHVNKFIKDYRNKSKLKKSAKSATSAGQ
jgi:hypothetical protein